MSPDITDSQQLARTVRDLRTMVPAKDFELSKKFYAELGFRPRLLSDRLVEMRLSTFAFILQDYYVQEWANNFAMHLTVSNVQLWWDRIQALDLPSRYSVKSRAPKRESWAVVAILVDPSGVIWQIAEFSSGTDQQ